MTTETGFLVKHIHDIPHIPQRLKPLPSSLSISLKPLRLRHVHPQPNSHVPCRVRHAPRPTDIDLSIALPQILNLLTIMPHAVLHMLAALAALRGTAIGPADLDRAGALPLIKLVAVQVVDLGAAAAKEQQRGRQPLAAGGHHGGALLGKGAEGRDAGARGDADDGGALGVRRQAERGARGADGDGDGVAWGEGVEVGRGHAHVLVPCAGQGRAGEDREGDGCVGGVGEGGGGDGVLADGHRGQESEEDADGDVDGGEALERVEDGDALGKDLVGVAVARETGDLSLGFVVLNVLEEDEEALDLMLEGKSLVTTNKTAWVSRPTLLVAG